MSIWTTYMQYVFFNFLSSSILLYVVVCHAWGTMQCLHGSHFILGFFFFNLCLPNQKQTKKNKHTQTFKINLQFCTNHEELETLFVIYLLYTDTCNYVALQQFVDIPQPLWIVITTVTKYINISNGCGCYSDIYKKKNSYEFLWIGFGPS